MHRRLGLKETPRRRGGVWATMFYAKRRDYHPTGQPLLFDDHQEPPSQRGRPPDDDAD